MSYVYLGAATAPQYYASADKLKWASNDLKVLHRSMKKLDVDWRMMLKNLPVDLLSVFSKEFPAQVKASLNYPLPIAADIAVLLELMAAGLPLDVSSKNIAAFMRDRCVGSAGLMGTAATVATVLAVAVSPTMLVDFGLSTAVLVSTAASLSSGVAVMALLAALFDALSKGKSPDKKTMAAVLKGGAAMAGKKLSDKQARAQAQKIGAAYDKQRDKAAALTKAESASGPGKLPSGSGPGKLPSGSEYSFKKQSEKRSEPSSKVSPILVLGGAVVAGLGFAMVLKRKKRA